MTNNDQEVATGAIATIFFIFGAFVSKENAQRATIAACGAPKQQNNIMTTMHEES